MSWDSVIPTITDVTRTTSIGAGITGIIYLVPPGKRWQVTGFGGILSTGGQFGVVPCTDVTTNVNLWYTASGGGTTCVSTRGGTWITTIRPSKAFTPFELTAGQIVYIDWIAGGAGETLDTAIIYKEKSL